MSTNIMAELSDRDYERLQSKYPKSYVFLIDDVDEAVKEGDRTVKSPYGYIIAYANGVGWNDDMQGERDIMDSLLRARRNYEARM